MLSDFATYAHRRTWNLLFFVQETVEKETNKNVKHKTSPTNLKIAGDGAWNKRGFT